ncbi:Phosphopentomutase [Nitrospira sp. KM1]|uniref:phosphopentomutase n=1 Tax=Nitrospira sp. KM1 TaxID=1936990 RepID=UPI0013A76008|nr:phosphopentomutase [Nitrospira sp. KM1]BCA53152.1 Phosphopentomutase [Nitrospira sp. KM1]
MINRVFLFVIDGMGVGEAPDASKYQHAGVNTLAHLADRAGDLHLPTLESLGLGHVTNAKGLRQMAQPHACFGRLAFCSTEVDSLTGNWEIAGCVYTSDRPVYAERFPDSIITEIDRIFGRNVLGNTAAFGPEVLHRYGKQSISHAAPIIWTDGRRSCHIAAHERVLRIEELYQHCREARKSLKETTGLIRIVAHPLEGEAAAIRFKPARRDFAIEPPHQTMLDVLNRASQILIGVGKIGDLFSGRGLTRSTPVTSWSAAFDEVKGMLTKVPRGLIYAGLDLFHTGPHETAASLTEFDGRLPELLEQLRPGDLFILTGDHGRDMSRTPYLPTREYVPLLVTGPKLSQGVNLGTRSSAADLAQTIVEVLRGAPLPVGDSFIDALQAG